MNASRGNGPADLEVEELELDDEPTGGREPELVGMDPTAALEERMAAQAEQRESATSEDFPVPGWDSTTWVRLKVVGYKRQKAIIERVDKTTRNRKDLELNVAAEILLEATDGFYGVGDDDKLVPVQTSWNRMAQRVYKVSPEAGPRAALIRLIGNERVMPFYTRYMDWLTGERGAEEEALAEVFQRTR